MVGDYKWTLRHGGGKLICPKCGQRRFVPYVSTADGKTLAGAEYGRCDREQNCGYQRYPGKEVNADGITPVEIMPEPPLRFYPAAVVVDADTPLFEYVAKLVGVSRALDIWNRYKIGRDGKRTVFWQIAKDGTIRAGKSIPYLENGHRDKTDKYPANWLHKTRAWDGMHTGEELQQCYFGEHLLNERKDARVMIVESEKTAAILSEYSRKFVWLASGGSQGLKNEEKNKALAGRSVTLLPDHGQYWNWASVANANRWAVLDYCERYPIFDGCDVLDYITAGVWPELLKKCKL
jgi:hypothetical protein